jgi:hypothetical protein
MEVSYLPGVVRANYVKDFILDITFTDGTRKQVDLSQWFKGPVFEPLKRKAYFKKFFVEAATIGWPNGVDISPEALYDADDAAELGSKGTRAKRR